MNKFIGVGTLPRSGTLNGNEKKVLRFTLATKNGHGGKDKKSYKAFVPCVVFRPSEPAISLLTGDPKGVLIGLEGRVNTSKFETKDGQTKYSTEVIVDERSLEVLELQGIVEASGDENGSEW
ncbi:MAG: single-stranded DNA-binding protein [bacterium]